jgi:hypothetical protein
MADPRQSPMWPMATKMFSVAMILFVFTIVVGILNGLDVYTPDHDTLLTHVHAGTLGWLTLSVAAVALLIFTESGALSDAAAASATRMAWSMTVAIPLYVLAFFAGDRIPGDRIQRPIFGTLLFIVVIWFGIWLIRQNKAHADSSVVRLGIMLSWLSLSIGAVFGVLLGIFTSQGEIPGLSDDTARSLADAHPPSMVIGFLILAAVAINEWLIRDARTLRDDKWGVAQMWLIFVAGAVLVIAFIIDNEELLGPATLMELVGVGIVIGRLRAHMSPSGWKGAGVGTYARLSLVFLVANMFVFTYLLSRVISEAIDIDAPTDSDLGLILTLDHLMFVGVMTLALFGVMAKATHPGGLAVVDKIVLYGVGLGVTAFGIGLIAVEASIKQLATPVLGVALLIGIGMYIMEMMRSVAADSS